MSKLIKYRYTLLSYPVVYFLPGFNPSIGGASWLAGLYNRAPDTDDDYILVFVNGENMFHGSFYANSPVTGNWEDFIVQELVDEIDSNFRTLAHKDARGLAGHSMGGSGALNIGLKHPDVFSAVYSMSPGIFNENGMLDAAFAETVTIANSMTAIIDTYSGSDTATADYVAYINSLSYDQNWQLFFGLGYGAAFAPATELGAPFTQYPYAIVAPELQAIEPQFTQWDSGYGGVIKKLEDYNMLPIQLNAFTVEYGTNDQFSWIVDGCEYFEEMSEQYNIDVNVTSFNGGHGDQLEARITNMMVPFFREYLLHE